MTRVTLIQCTDSKRDESAKARDLYDESRYFRKMRAWAEDREVAYGSPWFILSAKHELVAPDEVLEPYDAFGLSEEQAESIAADLDGMGVTATDVTAGRKYTDPLIPALERRGVDVVNHFAGKRIGARERLLKQATVELQHGEL